MFTRRSLSLLLALPVTALFSVGCFSNKNKDVAETAAAPPPAAYPDSSSSYGGTTSAALNAAPSVATTAATNSATAPAPFSLREGEQLVSHQIQSGESLSSIAAQYNSSISRIKAANGMTSDKIIAGKAIQVPTSAAPANLAMNNANQGGATPGYSAPQLTPSAPGGYPSAVAPPTVPTAPVASSSPYPSGGIAAPPVPSVPQIQVPSNPASTSYPRVEASPAPVQPGGSYPVPSFQDSRIQFSE
jgi:LysM repeat protein